MNMIKTRLSEEQLSALTKTEAMIKERLPVDATGHDWWHVERVRNNARTIFAGEGCAADQFVVELAALLHDIADFKFHDGDITKGPAVARDWLESIHVAEPVIAHVCSIVEHISYKGANVENKIQTDEGKIVQDADRLDAIGAIGIARAFAYGGHKNRPIYEPHINPIMHQSFDEYKSSKGHTINHFYEKLLLLRQRLNTETAKTLAASRHQFMERFLEQFLAEWTGDA